MKKFIKDTYEYFDVVDFDWWDSFFNDQSGIISNSTNGHIFFKSSFRWP